MSISRSAVGSDDERLRQRVGIPRQLHVQGATRTAIGIRTTGIVLDLFIDGQNALKIPSRIALIRPVVKIRAMPTHPRIGVMAVASPQHFAAGTRNDAVGGVALGNGAVSPVKFSA